MGDFQILVVPGTGSIESVDLSQPHAFRPRIVVLSTRVGRTTIRGLKPCGWESVDAPAQNPERIAKLNRRCSNPDLSQPHAFRPRIVVLPTRVEPHHDPRAEALRLGKRRLARAKS